jgi:hypothetical protein
VYADVHFRLSTLGPIARSKCLLSRGGCMNSVFGSSECNKERVTSHVHHVTILLEGAAEQLIVRLHDSRVVVGAHAKELPEADHVR